MAETASRSALENALLLYASQDREEVAKTFLHVLSVDELLFLAEFLGSCILIASSGDMNTWDAIARRANTSHQGEDANHKLMLMSEFAACCGFLVKFL